MKNSSSTKDLFDSLLDVNVPGNSIYKIMLLNLKFDWQKQNLHEEMVNKFLNKLINEAELDRNSKPILFYFSKVVEDNPDTFLFQSLRYPKPETRYTRIMDILDFFEYNIKPEITDLIEKNNRALCWDMLIEKTITSSDYYMEMKSRDPCCFFWATTLDRFEKISNNGMDGDRLAIELRNILGLHRVQKDYRLICIVFPQSATESVKKVAPTTLDSIDNPFFSPSDDPRGFGYSLNIETLEDGAEEVLINKISFDEHGGFNVIPIGTIKDKPPIPDYNVLLQRCIKRIQNGK